MSRAIKFRAWDSAQQKMRDHLDPQTIQAVTFGNDYGGRVIIMQFTGLPDKTGKEIYEGDVLKVDDERDEDGQQHYTTDVRFEDGAFLVEVRGQEHDQTALGWAIKSDWFSCEILGNIYEHPELVR